MGASDESDRDLFRPHAHHLLQYTQIIDFYLGGGDFKFVAVGNNTCRIEIPATGTAQAYVKYGYKTRHAAVTDLVRMIKNERETTCVDSSAEKQLSAPITCDIPPSRTRRMPVKGDTVLVDHENCSYCKSTKTKAVVASVTSSIGFCVWIPCQDPNQRSLHGWFGEGDDNWQHVVTTRRRSVSMANLDSDTMVVVKKKRLHADPHPINTLGNMQSTWDVASGNCIETGSETELLSDSDEDTTDLQVAEVAIRGARIVAPTQSSMALLNLASSNICQEMFALLNLMRVPPPDIPHYNQYDEHPYRMLMDADNIPVWIKLNETSLGVFALFTHTDGTIFMVHDTHVEQMSLTIILRGYHKVGNICMAHCVEAFRARQRQLTCNAHTMASDTLFSGLARSVTKLKYCVHAMTCKRMVQWCLYCPTCGGKQSRV